ncbi:uncharacterized protein LOC127877853 isoform X4 [Dreissena polymorpha]|uniref:uncharacterized protein LOC127877853 isoform X4 n=1 Tax=Dreissena polymorpha TaxID=45954 RepID=UPI00226467FB|nr:uncharacterized protein LOC127877853 isoform X4 [Dreissena polymorpha]
MADQVPGRRRQLSHDVAVSEEAMNEAKKAQEHLNSFFKKVSEQGIIPVTGFEQEEKINKKLIEQLKQDIGKFEKGWNEAEIQLQEKNKAFVDLLEIRNYHLQHISTLENAVKKFQQDIEDRDRTIISLGNDLQSLSKEHYDLKSRFSKVADHMLPDQNPDIADLSDPNRAMKLSDKFGALYDDAWTDAFEDLTDKQKQKPNEAIQFLLESLKKMQGGKPAVRLGSKDQRVIRDACRKIAPTVGVVVNQCFIMKMKKSQKLSDDCLKYLEGCIDVCWLMALAEPPLYIDFNIKKGDRLDPHRHTAHSESGDTVQFLVWPPLYNAEEGGGLLSKGTVSTERKVGKPAKK